LINASRHSGLRLTAIGDPYGAGFRAGYLQRNAGVPVPDVTSAEEQIFACLSEVSMDIKSHLTLISELKARRGNEGTRAVHPPLEIPGGKDPAAGD
jgi:hypothetical protein